MARAVTPFRRCLRCNALLQPAHKGEISHRLATKTREYFEEFHRCPSCDRIYWKGSHYEGMCRFIAEILHPF